MNRDTITDGSFGPEDFAGWPETPSAEELERAIDHVRRRSSSMIITADTSLKSNIELCEASMHNSLLELRINPAELMQFASDAELTTLATILENQETQDSFAGAIIIDDTPDEPGHRTLIGLRNIFGLLRQQGWMGLSPHLTGLKNTHVHALESQRNPGTVSAFIAVPPRLMTPDVSPPGPVPSGEPARLRDIAKWHGAHSFHWVAYRH